MTIKLSQKIQSLCKHVVFCIAILLLSGCSQQSGNAANEEEMSDGDNSAHFRISNTLPTVSTYEEAMKIAKDENKIVMVFFTKLIFSRNCKLMISEVVNTPEFAVWLKEKVVLVYFDFSEKDKATDESLALYPRGKVTGFPFAMFFSSDDEFIGKVGYRPDGAKEWIAFAEKVIADNKKSSK